MAGEQDSKKGGKRSRTWVGLVVKCAAVTVVALLLNTDAEAALVGTECGPVTRTEGKQRAGFPASAGGRLILWYWQQHHTVKLKFTLWLQHLDPPNSYSYPALSYTTQSQINRTMKVDFSFSEETQSTTVAGRGIPDGKIYERQKLTHVGVVSDKAVVWTDCTRHDTQSHPTDRRPSDPSDSTPEPTPPRESTANPTSPSNHISPTNPTPNPIPSTNPIPNPIPSINPTPSTNPISTTNPVPHTPSSTTPAPNPTSASNPIPDATSNSTGTAKGDDVIVMPTVVVVLVVVLVLVVMMVLAITIVVLHRRRDASVDEALSTMDWRYQSLLRQTERSPPQVHPKPNRHPTPPPAYLKADRPSTPTQVNQLLEERMQPEDHVYEELAEFRLSRYTQNNKHTSDKTHNTSVNTNCPNKDTDTLSPNPRYIIQSQTKPHTTAQST